MYCKYCGTPVDNQTTFCSNCGRRIARSNTDYVNVQSNGDNDHDLVTTGHTSKQRCSTAERRPNVGNGAFEAQKQSGSNGRNRPARKILHIIYIVILICAALYSLNPDNNLLNIHDMRKAYACSKEVITDCILTPTYKFPKFDADFVNQRPKKEVHDGVEYRVFTVSAYVDIANIFGTLVRSDYIVDIGFPTDQDIDGIYYEIVYF